MTNNQGNEPRLLDVSPETIELAANALKDGGLVAFPTETVYGLGADATSDEAVAKIFEAKSRPTFNPLIVHVKDAGQAALLVEFTPTAQKLAQKFWPGPLTMVLKRGTDSPLSLLVSAGLDTVAVRVPNHIIAQALLERSGVPLAAPSANKSGTVSSTAGMHVASQFRSGVEVIIDGGSCPVGIESTIIDLSGAAPVILRPGAITKEEIETEIGPVSFADGDEIKAPGMMKSHYAPSIPLRMNITPEQRSKGEAFLTFGPDAPRRAALNLSKAGDLREAAANLFTMIRALDQPGIRGIAVMPIPDTGLGRAINDRLVRAAAPRDDDAEGFSCSGSAEPELVNFLKPEGDN
ncbi:MAG: L-threonylcarbamoyladenylate synthase [Rhodospirillaceae bacterium]|nr:L-threonylcarbamoyladenylate synthase [Rhodospirillaceae bacterium]